MTRHHKHSKHHKGSNRNEGEGSRSADRAYTRGLQSFIEEDRVDPAAQRAKSYVEEHPTEAERDEMAGKAGPRPIAQRVEDLATEGKAMFQRAVKRVRSIIDKRRHRSEH
jgi:hypothetical protein